MAVLIPSIATIFLLSPGTGSTSLSSWFIEHMDGIWIIPGRLGKHATPQQIAATGLDLSRYTIVTTTRNPFDFYISQYHKKRTWAGQSPDFLLAKENSFDVFLRAFLEQTPDGHLHPIFLNAADVVLRKECLEEDVNLFLSNTRRPLTARLPSLNVAEDLNHDLQNWYDSTLLAQVERKHQSHLERFGYTCNHLSPQQPLALSEAALQRLQHIEAPYCDPLVLPGKQGWLYLSDESNQVVSSSAGQYGAHEHWIYAWKTELAERTRLAQAVHADLGTYIAPNTHSGQPDQLPDEYALSPDRPVKRLIAEVDGLDYLLQPLRDPDCFIANDSHYSEYGAYLVYRHICLQHGLSPLTIDKSIFEHVQCIGDLGAKLFPARGATRLIIGHKQREQLGLNRPELILQSSVKSTGKLEVFYNPLAQLPDTLLIFGDSYANQVVRFMSHNFRHVVILHSTRPPLELIASLAPRLVLFIHAERFMIQVPQQQAGGHLEDYRVKLEQILRAQGSVPAPSYQLGKLAALPGLLPEVAALENIYDRLLPNNQLNLGKLRAMGETLLHRNMDSLELLDKLHRHPNLASAMAEILNSAEFASKNNLHLRADAVSSSPASRHTAGT